MGVAAILKTVDDLEPALEKIRMTSCSGGRSEADMHSPAW